MFDQFLGCELTPAPSLWAGLSRHEVPVLEQKACADSQAVSQFSGIPGPSRASEGPKPICSMPRATTKMYQGMQQRCLYITQPTQRAGWSGHFNGALCFTDADGAGEPVVGSSGSQWSQHSEFLGPGDWWRGPWCCNSGAPGDVKQDTPGDANSGNIMVQGSWPTRPRWKVPKHGVWTIDVLDAPW